MALVVEITNQSKLEKLRRFFGAKSESEIVDIALDVTFRELEKKQKSSNGDLPENYFEDLSADESNSPDKKSVSLRTDEDETEEDFDIDVHKLNRIPPKKSFRVKANFKFVGRRKPMKYDFSDFVEDVIED